MAKNIIICCDGTNNQFGSRNTNVVRLYQCMDQNANQVAYYDPGVGTIALPGWKTRMMKTLSRWWDLAFAAGIMGQVTDALRFLMVHHEPGDRVYMFGFSRGAYTVRMLAAMLKKCGLPLHGNESLLPYFESLFKRHRVSPLTHAFKATFGRPCPVRFLGLWDTVSTVGYVWSPDVFDFTFENDEVAFVRHAMAVDERRGFFRTNRWKNLSATDTNGTPLVRQAFFPGVHSDVGGGYPDGELWKHPFKWISSEAAAAGMNLDTVKRDGLLGRNEADWHRTSRHESVTIPWRLAGITPKQHSTRLPNGDWKKRLAFSWPKPREIHRGELLHKSVPARWNDCPDYRPPNLDAATMETLTAQLSGGPDFYIY